MMVSGPSSAPHNAADFDFMSEEALRALEAFESRAMSSISQRQAASAAAAAAAAAALTGNSQRVDLGESSTQAGGGGGVGAVGWGTGGASADVADLVGGLQEECLSAAELSALEALESRAMQSVMDRRHSRGDPSSSSSPPYSSSYSAAGGGTPPHAARVRDQWRAEAVRAIGRPHWTRFVALHVAGRFNAARARREKVVSCFCPGE
jgi:hypothetical protein